MLAVVTGASKGIGKATVNLLKAEGYEVVATSRSEPEVGDHRFRLDVSNRAEVEAIMGKIKSEIGPIDVVVNNAGFGIYGSFLETSIEEEEYMIKTNFLGPIYVCKTVYPDMVKRRSGSIVNVVSEAAYVNSPVLLVYSSTKAGLASFTNGLWVEARKYGVKVSGIYPGPVKTNFSSHPSFKGREITPKYAVEPERVAKAILKGIRTGKREIYVPSKLLLDPYFLKLTNVMQEFTYRIVDKFSL
ncbi:SDR family NAD(P)-dependent oxidoreductase [Metallosphaera hakonensis]|uniref:3-oxoacyl-ACP reductase n=1 Tax=Metallosphaera hakonensis JCM 8857 = DSM 7519 TaxID=1293036 RepID=A0A2U9IV99_9CREN|nr:SDR family NAD(P)-dependent oxidoreductase [Metallosphaera hakonensis]AWR99925.1 SDR family NAD(P)-dependent oxidoreductase [Metallosphaera hakonensis JCM 8857 = DSM 7519]